MNLRVGQRIVKTGSLMLIICFSFSFFYGVVAAASVPLGQISGHNAYPHFTSTVPGNSAGGFDTQGSNQINFNSVSNANSFSASSKKSTSSEKNCYVHGYTTKKGTHVKGYYRRCR
jgi:hypothetical protein